jgi:hypothetical protein
MMVGADGYGIGILRIAGFSRSCQQIVVGRA